MSIRRGDQVVVISGKNKGKKGRVLEVEKKEDGKSRVTVEGVNIIVKHKKARNAKQKSSREKRPAPIDISNVMILCKCGKVTRIGYKVEKGKKNRVCTKCGEVLDKKFIKIKEKSKDAAGEEMKEEEKEKVDKKPLVRREIKHTADSKIKKPQTTTKAVNTHRQLGGS